MPPERSARAIAARMPATSVARPPYRGSAAFRISAAASPTALDSSTSLAPTIGLLGGSRRSKPASARGQPFFRSLTVCPFRSTSRSSQSSPQKGQVTCSNSSDGARSPMAWRAVEVGMRLTSSTVGSERKHGTDCNTTDRRRTNVSAKSARFPRPMLGFGRPGSAAPGRPAVRSNWSRHLWA